MRAERYGGCVPADEPARDSGTAIYRPIRSLAQNRVAVRYNSFRSGAHCPRAPPLDDHTLHTKAPPMPLPKFARLAAPVARLSAIQAVLPAFVLMFSLSTTPVEALAQAPAPTSSAQGSSKLDAMPKDLQKIDTKQGAGAEAVSGKPVIVHYTGWLYDASKPDKKGAKFDSSRDRQVPFGFFLGAGKVIKGWDDGVVGMKVGGQRTLVIPPGLAYGDRAMGNVIPANSTLIFDVELIDVK
jgi:FKBP-type peptidyl-prolyl cis-trans isomerase FkpA